MVKSIEEFLPYRNEAIEIFLTVAQYSPTTEFAQRTHRFFESLIPYMSRPAHISSYSEWDFDNFKFLIYELFLYVLAVFLKKEWFAGANHLLEQQYYIAGDSDHGTNAMVTFTEFRQYLRSLEQRDRKLNRLSVRADLLHQRCKGIGIEFRHLLQADFVAFMRADIESKDHRDHWWPETLLYLRGFNGPLEIFARSESKAYFNRVKGLLAIDSSEDLEPLLKSYQDGSRELPRWEFESFNPAVLLGYELLATRP